MISDSFADFLTCLRNGGRARLRFVDVLGSKLIVSFLKLLTREGWVEHFICKEEGPKLRVRIFLKYDDEKNPILSELKRISRPGRRRYLGYSEIYKHKSGMGLLVLSTPKGLMTGYEARKEKVGGELLCSLSY